MRTTPLIAAALLCALLAAQPAGAATVDIDETYPAARDTRLEIELIAGSVSVRGWDRPEIRITGRYDDEYFEWHVDSTERVTTIDVEPIERRGRHRSPATVIEIQVPAGAAIDFESVSADLRVERVEGVLAVESVSGDLELSGASLEVDASTVSGRVAVTATELREGGFESVSGRIEVRGRLAAHGRFSFETVSGEILLYLSPDTSADFSVEAFSGEIENRLGPAAEKSSKWLPSTSLEFSLGGGAARVTAETVSGSIRILPE